MLMYPHTGNHSRNCLQSRDIECPVRVAEISDPIDLADPYLAGTTLTQTFVVSGVAAERQRDIEIVAGALALKI